MIQYQFIGQRRTESDGTLSTAQILRPVYGDKCALKYTMADNTRYYKPSWDGSLKFEREDYVWIMSAIDNASRYEVTYLVDVKWKQPDDAGWFNLCTLQFVFTDCEVNEDDGIITVKPSVKTLYQEVEDGLNREFNLVETNPQSELIYYYRRPYIQVYCAGSNKITNIQGDLSWEVDAESVSLDITLINTYKFALAYGLRVIQISNATGLIDEANDTYLCDITTPAQSLYYFYGAGAENKFRLALYYQTDGSVSWYRLAVRNIDTTEDLAWYDFPSSTTTTQLSAWANVPGTDSGIAMTDDLPIHQSYCSAQYNTTHLYSRVLCDVAGIGQHAAVDRPTDDICEYSSHYPRVIAYSFHDVMAYSINVSQTPNKWGRIDNDAYRSWYWDTPTTSDLWMPAARSSWAEDLALYISFWYKYLPLFDMTFRVEGASDVALHDAYPLWASIKALLAEVAPDVTFENTTDYSEFLFAVTNPVLNVPNQQLFITQKSNILKANYNIAAQNAPIQLKHILDFLRIALNCYWYIDNKGAFHIEHVSWFMKGGTYSTAAHVIGADLTTMRNTRNGKPWSFAKGAYQFGKADMPSTVTFGWMDEVSEPFMGYQMKFASPLVNKEKNDELTIDKFTSDIDYVLNTPGDISKDGFFVFACQYDNKLEAYAVADVVVNNVYLSNGFLSFAYLETSGLLLYNVPEGDVDFANGDSTNTVMQSRNMEQRNVIVPLGEPPFNPTHLIRTSLGDGEIKDITINLSSITANATLRYDTQQ